METDILGGVQMGYRTVLVLSGGTRREDLARYAYRPDVVVESIADLCWAGNRDGRRGPTRPAPLVVELQSALPQFGHQRRRGGVLHGIEARRARSGDVPGNVVDKEDFAWLRPSQPGGAFENLGRRLAGLQLVAQRVTR